MKLNTLENGKIISKDFTENFDFETDLLIAGLGTAGAVCYYTAIREGINCIGIEKQSLLGGTGTCACVQDYYYGQLCGTLTEINQKASENEVFAKAKTHPTESAVMLCAKAVAVENESNENSKIFTNCIITGVFLENNIVCGVRAFKDGKFINIRAKIVADNTNGFVAKLSGCEVLGGRDSDLKTMRASKTVAFLQDGKVHGEWNSLGFIDDLDEYELSTKYLESEAKPPILLEKSEDEKRPVFTGTIIGKRECDRVKTDYIIDFDDLISLKDYERTIFNGFASFDNVNDDLENETENLQNWILLTYMRHIGLTFSVPLETLLPKGLENILVIGKAIGTTHDAASLIRMKAEMEKCGEAAAYIAQFCINGHCKTREIDYNKLKERLVSSGCLSLQETGFFELRKSENSEREKVILPQTTEELKQCLSSEKPQFALFSIIKYQDENLRKSLLEWLNSDNKTLKTNCAIALGLIKDERALPALRNIIQAEPEIHNIFNGKHYFSWLEYDIWSDFIKAVVLVGRFKDKKSLNTLENLKEKEFNDTLKRLRIYQYIDEAIKTIKKG